MGGLGSRTAVPPLGTGRAHVYCDLGVFGGSQRHDRACLTAILGFLVGLGWHGRANASTGRASGSGQGGQKISPFRIVFGQKPTKQIKTTQNKQK